MDTIANRQERTEHKGSLLALLVLAGTLCSCATVSVAPGHRAVVLLPDGSRQVLGEGEAELPGLAQVDDFDLRQQERGDTLRARTSDGVSVVVTNPSVTYGLIESELADADRTMGTDPWPTIVAPIVHSVVASVLATYRWDALDPAGIREAQARITQIAAARLRPYHIALASIELKGISLRLPGLQQAITETSVWEQQSASEQSRIEVARQRADALRQQANGIAAAHAQLAPTLTPYVLSDKQEQAWKALITSPTTTVRVAEDVFTSEEVTP